MPCNTPLPAWRARLPNEAGRLPVVFNFHEADHSLPVNVPCGRCIGCRLEKAHTWATRILHEAKVTKPSWFVTLTYDDAHLPVSPSGLPTLRPVDMVLFLKRLRKALHTEKIRYYQCGEYGDETLRPHHHAIVFGLQLADLKPLGSPRARNAHALYTSALLVNTWKQGHISVGAVTYETAAYVASYTTKKITGAIAESHYKDRVHEYSTMSRRPGIGAAFLDRFADDIYPSDEVIIRGHPMRPPKYYDRRLERRDPEAFSVLQAERRDKPKHRADHRERAARELMALQRLKGREPT